MKSKWGGMVIGSVAMALLLMSGSAYAVDITIPDNMGVGTGWYGAQEDNEVEPNCSTGQQWDLEQVDLTGNMLTLIGGWNFQGTLQGFASGDLFLSLGNMPLYGPAAAAIVHSPDDNNGAPAPSAAINHNFNYDYVFDMDWTTGAFNVVDISGGAVVLDVAYRQNNGSNPVSLIQGGQIVGRGYATFGAVPNGPGHTGGTTGNSHYTVSFNLDQALGTAWHNQDMWTHFTMQCGNDDLMGHSSAVPEPSTLLLLGMGVLGSLARRRFFA